MPLMLVSLLLCPKLILLFSEPEVKLQGKWSFFHFQNNKYIVHFSMFLRKCFYLVPLLVTRNIQFSLCLFWSKWFWHQMFAFLQREPTILSLFLKLWPLLSFYFLSWMVLFSLSREIVLFTLFFGTLFSFPTILCHLTLA